MKNQKASIRLEERIVDSPLGPIWIAIEGENLISLKFAKSANGAPSGTKSAAAKEIDRALRGYFKGDLKALDDISISPSGTDFQQRVWNSLRDVEPGEVTSYSELAAEAGFPGSARAVGTTMAINPTAIVVPCHRVLRSDGSLGGYGGGLDKKRWLLRHEGAVRVKKS